MGAQLKRSAIVAELEKGGSLKAIAERLHITIPLLKKAKDHFNKGLDKSDPKYINLRSKPKTEVMEFIDDSESEEFMEPKLVEGSEKMTSQLLD